MNIMKLGRNDMTNKLPWAARDWSYEEHKMKVENSMTYADTVKMLDYFEISNDDWGSMKPSLRIKYRFAYTAMRESCDN